MISERLYLNPLTPLFPQHLDQATREWRQLRENLAEKMDRIKQYRVLGRDNVGRRNKSEEGKNSNAKPRDGYGPGLLFLGKSLPLDW